MTIWLLRPKPIIYSQLYQIGS